MITHHAKVTADGLTCSSGGLSLRRGRPGVRVLLGPQEWLIDWHPWRGARREGAGRETPAGRSDEQQFAWTSTNGFTLTWRVSRLEHLPGLSLRAVFHNGSRDPVRLREFVLCDAALRVTGPHSRWWLGSLNRTPSDGPLDDTGPIRTFADFATLYTADGTRGVTLGAVGPAEADVRITVSGRQLTIASEMTDILVDPGESRCSEEVLLLAQPYPEAAERLLRWVAATHGARTHRGPIAGWCSWYDLLGEIHAPHVEAVAAAVRRRRNRLPVQVIQIDEGYQRHWGDWACNAKFPGGWPPVVEAIHRAGATPGIWIAPLGVHDAAGLRDKHPAWFQRKADGALAASLSWRGPGYYLDPTHPEVQGFLRGIIRAARGEGFAYFKIDFNTVVPCRFHNPKMTRFQAMRELYRLYREEMGEASYLNACVFGIHRAVVGFADAARVGGDSMADWTWILKSIAAVGASAAANGILFASDPDVTYMLPRGPVTETQRRTWHGFVGLLGGLTMISEPLHQRKFAAADRMTEILWPPSPERGRSFHAGSEATHRQFGFVAERAWGRFAVMQLWNPAPRTASVALVDGSIAPLGRRVHVWSFWDARYHGIRTAGFVARRLPPDGGAVLRFTPAAKHGEPVLVGSTLHIACGAAEIANWSVNDGVLAIDLNDAGAREGRLYVHCARPLTLEQAEGCTVSVPRRDAHAVWTLELQDRQRGRLQHLRLRVGPKRAAARSESTPCLDAQMEMVRPIRVMVGQRPPAGLVRISLVNPGPRLAAGAVLLRGNARFRPARLRYAVAAGERTTAEVTVNADAGVRRLDLELVAAAPPSVLPRGESFDDRGATLPIAALQGVVRTVWPLGTLLPCKSADGAMLARIRLRRRGATLVVVARVNDRRVTPLDPAWSGSCVEVFGAMPGSAKIGQVVVQPAAANRPPRAWQSEVGAQKRLTDVDLRCRPCRGGYHLEAVVPIRHLAINAGEGEFLVEVQVSAFSRDGVLRRGTLFGSTAAYADTLCFAAV